MVVSWANRLASLLIQPAPPGLTAPPWYVRILDSTNGLFLRTCRVQNLDIQQAGRVGTAPGRATGRCGSGHVGMREFWSPRRHRTLMLAKDSTKNVVDDFLEARASQNLCKPMENQNWSLRAFY